MSEKLLVPDIGEFENVEVIEILVKPGDQIKENDPVVTIESDKSSVEIPSTLSGEVESVEVKVGDKVSEGDLLLNLSSSKTLSKSTLPKDTENIIKQAETTLAKTKEKEIISQEPVIEKKQSSIKIINGAESFLIIWKNVPKYNFLYKIFKIKPLFFLLNIFYEIAAYFLFIKNKHLLSDEKK